MHLRMATALILGSTVTLSAACGAATAAPADQQTSYQSADMGFQALERAVESNDVEALKLMLGPGSDKLLSSGDSVQDKNARERFVSAYKDKQSVQQQGSDVAILTIGKDDWDFPIPMTKSAGGWRFDTAAGREELINRRIGRNERNAIAACQAFVDAEQEYASADRVGDGVLQYAQRFLSSPGKEDGLYWRSNDPKNQSPLGNVFQDATAAGYQIPDTANRPPDERSVLYGYKFKILTGQGSAAQGGAYNYVFNGKMIGGFAMVAYPAEYGASGIMTFMVNHDGMVFQKDLGPGTEAAASKMVLFNPDQTWKRT